MAFFATARVSAGKFSACWIRCLRASPDRLGFGAAPAAAQGVVKAKYGDWEMRCETPPGAPATNAR